MEMGFYFKGLLEFSEGLCCLAKKKLKVVEPLFSRWLSDGSQRQGPRMKLTCLLKQESVVLVSHSDAEACTFVLELS